MNCLMFLNCHVPVFRCDHEKRKSAVACITEVIGENNPEHFFVATQDAELRNKFHQVSVSTLNNVKQFSHYINLF